MNETTVFKELPCEVGPVELLEFGKKLSHHIDTVAGIQAGKKQSASEYKAMEEKAVEEMTATARVISTGIQYRDVECRVMFDHRRGVVETFRCDTAELVDVRRIKDYERQAEIQFPESDTLDGATDEDATKATEEANAEITAEAKRVVESVTFSDGADSVTLSIKNRG
jgi:hypothetical protein